MKIIFAQVGKMLITLSLIIATVIDVFINPKYWQSYFCLTVLACLWVKIGYKTIEGLKVGIKDSFIEIFGSKSRTETNENNGLPSKINAEKVNYHNEFAKMIRPSSTALRIDPLLYESPTILNVFLNLTLEAKKDNFDFKNDNMYIRLHKQIQSEVVLSLIRAIKAVYNTNKLNPHSKALINWCRVTPVNEKEIMGICKNIYSKDGKKDELTIQFCKAINDLKKLEI